MNIDQALAWINGGWKDSPYARTEQAGFGIDVDGYYGFQCVDFSEGYSIYLGSPFNFGIVRNAITLWTIDQPGWTKVTQPQAGYVFVKDYVAPDNIDYGHTGVVQQVAATGIWSMDQNWFNSSLTLGSPPARVFHPFDTIKGYLRCDKIGVAMVDDKITKEAYLVGEDRDLDSEPGGQGVYDYWRGRSVLELLTTMYNDPGNQNMRYRANNKDGGYPAIKAQLDACQASSGGKYVPVTQTLYEKTS